MNFNRFVPLLVAVSIAPAQGHPGHSLGEQGVAHVLGSPYHLFLLASCSVLFFVLSRILTKPPARRFCLGCAYVAIATAALIWTIGA